MDCIVGNASARFWLWRSTIRKEITKITIRYFDAFLNHVCEAKSTISYSSVHCSNFTNYSQFTQHAYYWAYKNSFNIVHYYHVLCCFFRSVVFVPNNLENVIKHNLFSVCNICTESLSATVFLHSQMQKWTTFVLNHHWSVTLSSPLDCLKWCQWLGRTAFLTRTHTHTDTHSGPISLPCLHPL